MGVAGGRSVAEACPVAPPMVAVTWNGVAAPALAAGVNVPTVPVPDIDPAPAGSTDQATALPSVPVERRNYTPGPPARTVAGPVTARKVG